MKKVMTTYKKRRKAIAELATKKQKAEQILTIALALKGWNVSLHLPLHVGMLNKDLRHCT